MRSRAESREARVVEKCTRMPERVQHADAVRRTLGDASLESILRLASSRSG